MDNLAEQIAKMVIEDTKYFSAIIGFMGVLCGSTISIVGSIIQHKLSAKKERRLQILQKELDRLYRLEEQAGEITEWAGSWQLSQESPKLRERFQNFMVASGTFRKYPRLKQAIRDLNQQAMILTSDKINNKDIQLGNIELEKKYEVFINEYRAVLNQIET